MEAQFLGNQKALFKRQLVREWTVFLNAWVCWIIKQKVLFSWKIFLQMLHQGGYWICHRQLLAKVVRLCFFQSREKEFRSDLQAMAPSSKTAHSFWCRTVTLGKSDKVFQRSLSLSPAWLPKSFKLFPCLDFHWVIKFWSNPSNPSFYRGKHWRPERLRDLPKGPQQVDGRTDYLKCLIITLCYLLYQQKCNPSFNNLLKSPLLLKYFLNPAPYKYLCPLLWILKTVIS